MKNIALICITVFLSINCKAQTKPIELEAPRTIIDLDTWDGRIVDNTYVKDIDNYLNQFVGTWVYNQNNQYLKIIIEKVVKSCKTDVYCLDYLIGEYQYKENNVEKINTLPGLLNERNHKISGKRILKNNFRPVCNDCYPNQRRVMLTFSDPLRRLGGELLLQAITVNGQPALKAFKRTTTYAISLLENSSYTEMNVPSGEYILIKE